MAACAKIAGVTQSPAGSMTNGKPVAAAADDAALGYGLVRNYPAANISCGLPRF
jgi:hypothetical protein